jgi:hypothetical protein
VKKVYSIAILTVVIVSISGCTSRNLNKEDRAAILGASMNQAMQNAHDAAYNEGAYAKKHHKHHHDDNDD